MHSYPLHRPVTVECDCCHVEREFTFTSNSDHVICPSCIRHQGDTARAANQRDRHHVGLWRSELEILREDHASQVVHLRGEIDKRDRRLVERQTDIDALKDAIRRGVENAPPETVQQWWESEKVTEAHTQRNQAYRSRDLPYRSLWAVDQLHHDDDHRSGYCSCGKRTTVCKELDAIAPAKQALDRWEGNQLDRLGRQLDHGLPNEHPEVLKLGSTYRRFHR
jgi:hypothetical protein